MKDIERPHLSWDEWDELQRPAPETTDFDAVVDAAITRRGFLSGVLAYGSGAAVMGTGLLSSTSAEAQAVNRFGFTPIPIQTDGTVHVPDGYSWQPVAKWGEAKSAAVYWGIGHHLGHPGAQNPQNAVQYFA